MTDTTDTTDLTPIVEAIREAREAYGRRVNRARRTLTAGHGKLHHETHIALANSVLDETLTFVRAIDDALAEA